MSIKGCGLPVNTRKEPPPGLRGAYRPLEGAVQLAQALGAPVLRPLDQTQVLIGRVVSATENLHNAIANQAPMCTNMTSACALTLCLMLYR